MTTQKKNAAALERAGRQIIRTSGKAGAALYTYAPSGQGMVTLHADGTITRDARVPDTFWARLHEICGQVVS